MITVLFVDICPVLVIGLLLARVIPFGRPVLQKNTAWDYMGTIGGIFTSLSLSAHFNLETSVHFKLTYCPAIWHKYFDECFDSK
jgi:hypothetical protein